MLAHCEHWHAGFWYRWFGGGWQEPQLVLLDHGLIIEIPDALRQHYCQLWCSFILNDQPSAKAIATQIAGKRFMLFLSSWTFGF